MTEIDYAIVGGGVAGTYCAWRLQKEYREKKKIELFEYSDRIGGRLLTLKPEEFDVVDAIRKKGGIDVNAELGGMRYLPDEHKIFVKVIEELKLKSKSFPMGDDYENRNGENNIVYLRHTHLRMKELRDPEKVPYPKLAWLEKGLDPDQLQYYVMKSYVPDYQNLEGPEQWGNVEIFGKKLYQFGFWNLLYRVLSPEAYTFLKYGSGYDTNVSNGNAAVLLPTGEEFSPEPSPNVDSTEKPEKPPPTKFRTLEDGLQALPLKLAEEFEKNKGPVKQ